MKKKQQTNNITKATRPRKKQKVVVSAPDKELFAVERHFISKSSPYFNECDLLTCASENLKNASICCINQKHVELGCYFIQGSDPKDKDWIFSQPHLYHAMKDHETFRTDKHKEILKVLPTKMLKQVLYSVARSFTSYFALKKHQDPAIASKAKLPKYSPKDGRHVVTFPKDAISFKKYPGYLHLSMTDIKIKSAIDEQDIKEVRITPKQTGFMVEVVYTKQPKPQVVSERYAAIDLGVANIAAVFTNDPSQKAYVVDGRPIKAANQYFNKKIASEKARLSKQNLKTSKRIRNLWKRRRNFMKNTMHRLSRTIVNWLVKQKVSVVVIGKNTNWKQEVNIGSTNNQNFCFIPHNDLVDLITYKANAEGITVMVAEESYTSKCSFLDKETVEFHSTYMGKRIKRGLFQSSKGTLINADINGCGNILRKTLTDAVFYTYNVPITKKFTLLPEQKCRFIWG